MRFFIDETEWRTPGAERMTRAEQLDALRCALARDGRIILEMLADGEALSEDDLMTIPDAVDIDVVSASEYGVGLAVLAELRRDMEAQSASLDNGTSVPDDLVGCVRYARQAIAMVAEAYPECEADPNEAQMILADFEALLAQYEFVPPDNEFVRRWHALGRDLNDFVARQEKDLSAMDDEIADGPCDGCYCDNER